MTLHIGNGYRPEPAYPAARGAEPRRQPFPREAPQASPSSSTPHEEARG